MMSLSYGVVVKVFVYGLEVTQHKRTGFDSWSGVVKNFIQYIGSRHSTVQLIIPTESVCRDTDLVVVNVFASGSEVSNEKLGSIPDIGWKKFSCRHDQ